MFNLEKLLEKLIVYILKKLKASIDLINRNERIIYLGYN